MDWQPSRAESLLAYWAGDSLHLGGPCGLGSGRETDPADGEVVLDGHRLDGVSRQQEEAEREVEVVVVVAVAVPGRGLVQALVDAQLELGEEMGFAFEPRVDAADFAAGRKERARPQKRSRLTVPG
eukprot:SM005817S18333  [mRNA]  locus=s5817:102:571:+ [translate_table: standard]